MSATYVGDEYSRYIWIGMNVNEVAAPFNEQEDKLSLWTKARWYAISPAFAKLFLRAGAQVCQAEEFPH